MRRLIHVSEANKVLKINKHMNIWRLIQRHTTIHYKNGISLRLRRGGMKKDLVSLSRRW